MRRIAVAVLASVATLLAPDAPRCQSPSSLEFDHSLDARGVVESLRHRGYDPRHDGWSYPQYYRTERDCATISFRRDDAARSERVTLESREYQERCYPRGPDGHMDCRDEWVWTERRHTRIELQGRGEMLPWEVDVFEVCLDGRWLSSRVVDASHEYALTEGPGDDFLARAGRKVASLPDPVGVVAESFRYDPQSKNFALTLRDRWSQYYAGEQLVVKLALKRHRPHWFDETLLEKELAFPTAETYAVDFAGWAGEMSPKPAPGKPYYVKWSFKRVGRVSKDKWQKSWESDKAVFEGAAASMLLASAADLGRACWFSRVESTECVYRCRDGSTLRRPVREGDPFDRDQGETIACPQMVIPF